MNQILLATATAAKSGSTVTATVNGVATTVQVERDTAVALGDVLLVVKVGAQWFATGRYFSAAPLAVENEPAPAPKPTVTTGRLVVSPVETRTYRSGGWTSTGNDSVYQGSYASYGNNTGSVFYGSKPRSLAGATVTDAKIRVRRIRGGAYAAQASTMRLMTQRTRPSGSPTLTSSTAGPTLAVDSTNDSFDVPNSWVQEMVDGTAGGLAFYDADGSPYIRFAGRGDWSPAFTLTISWQRTS